MTWQDIFKKVETLETRKEAMAKRLRSLLEDLTSETEKAIEGMQKKIGGANLRDLMDVEDELKDALEFVSSLNKNFAGLDELRRGE